MEEGEFRPIQRQQNLNVFCNPNSELDIIGKFNLIVLNKIIRYNDCKRELCS